MNIEQYFHHLTGFNPRQFQIETIDHIQRGNNVILRAPTGSGKMDTAVASYLYSVNSNPFFPRKLIYVVPLRTLANSLRARTEALARRLSLPLTVTLQTGENPEDPRFESDIIFCTIDQMLSSFLNIPYSTGRGSANINAGVFFASFLVFDEIHLLDFDRSFTSLLKVLQQVNGVVPSLLMTATLTSAVTEKLRETLGPTYPLEILGVSEEDLQRVEGSRARYFQPSDIPLTAGIILEDIKKFARHRVIVICNTVSQAQGLALDLRDIIEGENLDIDLTLLHSRFLPEDRRDKEEKLKRIFGKDGDRYSGCHILVATQVIEAGLDITCEVMHVHLCPMNSLLQRAGRCARFDGERGWVYVYREVRVGEEYQSLAGEDLIGEELESGGKSRRLFLPYENEMCERTWEVLSSADDLPVGFRVEDVWLGAVHDGSDRLQLERAKNDRAEFDQKFNKALFSGDESAATALIRKVDNRSIYVWEESPLIDFEEDEAQIDPQKLQAFSIPLTTLRGVLAEPKNIEYGTDWIFKRISTPKKKETYAKAICTPISSQRDLEESYRILVNPRYLSYDKEIGLRFGVHK